jgi:membrane protein DedA with SNARE-associated domain
MLSRIGRMDRYDDDIHQHNLGRSRSEAWYNLPESWTHRAYHDQTLFFYKPGLQRAFGGCCRGGVMPLTGILGAINDWVQNIVRTLGYPGLGFAMFLQTVIPPIPSELILPLAGWLTLSDDAGFTLLGVTIVGAIGSLAGALVFYGLGAWLDESRVRALLRRYGRWFLLREKNLDVALDWFDRHGDLVVFFGRLVPLVRSLISVPAGLTHMHLGKFAFYTTLGAAVWSFLLAFAGRTLGSRWDLVSEIIDPYAPVIIALAVLAVLAFFYTRWRKYRACKRDSQGAC